MKKHKVRSVSILTVTLLGLFSFALPLHSEETNSTSLWLTDYKKALTLAQKSNKPVLINFSGSDWCGWCIRLDEEVFSQSKFKEYAQKKLILLEVDFPRNPENKNLSEEQLKANQALAQRYQIKGFPTVLILNPEGKLVKTLGYMKGGPSSFIEALKQP